VLGVSNIAGFVQETAAVLRKEGMRSQDNRNMARGTEPAWMVLYIHGKWVEEAGELSQVPVPILR
jgi:hypothetical protein